MKKASQDGEATIMEYQDLRRRPRVDLVLEAPLASPLTVFVEPTNVCNFSCTFCPESFDDFYVRSGGRHKLSVGQFEEICRQILEVAPGGVKTLNFYMMGEPLINRETPEMIRIARSLNIAETVILTTNGSLLKGDLATKVIESEPSYVRVSIYGPNKVQHEKVTQSSIPFDRIVGNLREFIELRGPKTKPRLYLKMIDQGKEANDEFLQVFGAIGDEVEIEPVMNWNDPEQGNLAGISKEELLSSDYFANKKSVCPSPFYTLVIHADLRVSVCCVDWEKKAVVGDLNRETLKDVWNGQTLFDFQMKHLSGRRHEISACRNCTYLHTYPDNLDALLPLEFERRRKGIGR